MKRLGFAVLSLLAPATALAQDAPAAYVAQPPVLGDQRRGFFVSFGLGGGSVRSEDDSQADGGGVNVRAGAWINPRLAIVGQLDYVAGQDSEVSSVTVGQSFAGAAVIGYVHPRFYLTGGLGLSKLSLEQYNEEWESDDETAIMLGAGVQVYRTGGFELNVELHAFSAAFPGTSGDLRVTSSALSLGFQWN